MLCKHGYDLLMNAEPCPQCAAELFPSPASPLPEPIVAENDLSIPTFLRRDLNPELNEPWEPPQYSAVADTTAEEAEYMLRPYRRLYPLTPHDRRVIAELTAFHNDTLKAKKAESLAAFKENYAYDPLTKRTIRKRDEAPL